MAKPMILLWVYLRTLLAYPREILASYLTVPIQLIVMLSLLEYLEQFYTGEISYTISLCYIVLVAFYTRIIFLEDVSSTIANDIFNGSIDKYLAKPMPILVPYLCRSYMRRLFGLTVMIPVALASLHALGLEISPYRMLLFLALSHLSYALNFLINCIIGLLAVYTHRVYGVKDVLDTISFVLSGQLLPIYMYPEPVRLLATYTPFQAIVYLPLSSLLMDPNTEMVAVALTYLALLSIALLVMLKSFSRRYESAMG